MTKTAKIIRHASIAAFAAAVMLVVAGVCDAQQRDPFKKAGWATPKTPVAPGKKSAGPAAPVNFGPPPIDARIEYYKRIREQAVAAGRPVPKVTSVLTLGEMTVSGIFKTPRGWAAMVQATPINLSYTVYPGEKFFDGQLVAIEENRLVFKRVTKVGEGKFVASVENKPLRQYSVREQATGTAPAGANGSSDKEEKTVAAANQPPAQQPAADGSTPVAPKTAKAKPPTNPFLSPLDEMNSQPEKKDDKAAKKPTKVARNGN
ncbi:MAG TPA: hypothetical protein VGI80_05385 [Pyrinomonadaceae bacterium]